MHAHYFTGNVKPWKTSTEGGFGEDDWISALENVADNMLAVQRIDNDEKRMEAGWALKIQWHYFR